MWFRFNAATFIYICIIYARAPSSNAYMHVSWRKFLRGTIAQYALHIHTLSHTDTQLSFKIESEKQKLNGAIEIELL